MSSRAYDKQADGLRPKVIIEWNGTARWFELSTQIVVPNGREQIFDFFSDAFQLELITPEWLKFRILTPSPIRMGAGCLIDYCIHLHGLPVRWRTEISSWDPPFSFTDRQISGPYRMWEHFHSFEQIEDGTVVR
ncbi:MAG: SRPBCC family protein, partial [Planctomycetaceae bacterium]|nr:SRPBCC family protein [Planctomycetaceae bacterium]